MVQVIYRPRLREVEALRLFAENATSLLEEVIGATAEPVTAEWDRGENAALRSVAVLRLSDFSGWVTGIFDPEELAEPGELRSRLRFLWIDLLQIRSGKILESLLANDKEGDT